MKLHRGQHLVFQFRVGLLVFITLLVAGCGGGGGDDLCGPAPSFRSAPPTTAIVGKPYIYAVDAVKTVGVFPLPLLQLRAAPYAIQIPPGAGVSGQNVHWTPTEDWINANVQFRIGIEGNCGRNATQAWTVSVSPDTSPVKVLSRSPTPGAINIPINASIDAYFDKDIAPASVNASSFTLTGPSGPVAGSLVVSESRVTFQPSANLQLSTLYTATITTALKNLAGYGMAENYSWTFTTGMHLGSPAIPSLSVARVTASQVDLIWSAPSAAVTSVSGYRAYRDGVLQQSPRYGTFSITDWGLEFNSNHCYTVSAHDSSGTEVGQAGPLCVTTKDFVQDNVAHWGRRGLTNGASDLQSAGDPSGKKKSSFPDVLLVTGKFLMISLASSRGLALKSDGTIWELTISSSFPTPALPNENWQGPNDWIAVAAGGVHSLALRADGTVWAWGPNDKGQLGNGSITGSWTSAKSQVVGLTDVVAIAAGHDFSLAVKSNGTVWSWGTNNLGQLGDGTGITQPAPVQVAGLANVIAVAAGDTHSVALKADGTVWAWGENNFGQLGDGTVINQTVPVQVIGLTGAIAVSSGDPFSVALKADGTVWAWGNNYSGELGDGTDISKATPVQVVGLTNAIAVAAGGGHTLAVKSDGTVWAWGYNDGGQLGDGTNVSRWAPVQVLSITYPKAIFAGLGYSMALK